MTDAPAETGAIQGNTGHHWKTVIELPKPAMRKTAPNSITGTRAAATSAATVERVETTVVIVVTVTSKDEVMVPILDLHKTVPVIYNCVFTCDG